MTKTYNLWSESETEYLTTQMAAGVPVRDIALHLGRPGSSVWNRVSTLRLRRAKEAAPPAPLPPMDKPISEPSSPADLRSSLDADIAVLEARILTAQRTVAIMRDLRLRIDVPVATHGLPDTRRRHISVTREASEARRQANVDRILAKKAARLTA